MTDTGKSKKVILLTGAGFTKNFGGFLAGEMWSQIFNNPIIQKSELLRDELQDNFDFESVYSNIIDNPNIAQAEKDTMNQAILEAYTKLDDAIKGSVFSDSVNRYSFSEFIMLFNIARGEQGYFFTLNQDLFMERYFGTSSPAVSKFSTDFYNNESRDLNQTNFITLPSDDIENRVEKGIQDNAGYAYIKLHGSYGWKSASGSHQMVIGKNKVGSIGNEPLLKCYFDLFESVIKQGSKKILIIGYGFQDHHINQVLLEGVQNHGLKIIIVGQTPQSIKNRIENGHYYAKDILKGVTAYFPYSLKEIFPSQDGSVHFRDIKKALQD